jgi:hypothetical protein
MNRIKKLREYIDVIFLGGVRKLNIGRENARKRIRPTKSSHRQEEQG